MRAAFPKATIVRPSLVFGPEDELTNRFAGNGAAAVPAGDCPQTRFQPVYVRDLAAAITKAASIHSAMPGRPMRSAGRRS